MTHKEQADRRRRMAQAVSGGKSPARVSDEHNVCLGTVRNACRQHGVPISYWNTERDKQIATAAAEGRFAVDIASSLGVSPQHVYTVCRLAGQQLRRPPRPPWNGSVKALRTVSIVCDLLAGEGNQREVADQNNVTPQWVSLISIELGKRGLLPSESS